MILVTGASGNVGAELTKLLARRGVGFRAMVRSPGTAARVAELAGADAVVGDFDDRGSVARALVGIERAFLLTSSSEKAETQQLAFVAEAARAGVRHVVKLSQLAADRGSAVRFLRYHAVVEDAIRESGLAYTFLRPNLFMQGLLAFRDSIIAQDTFFAAAGQARISTVDVRDIAAVAAAGLTEDGHEGRVYDITGPEALTHADMARQLSEALGRHVEFVDIPEEAMREALLGFGFPAWQAEGLIEDYAHYRHDEAATVARGVSDATGSEPRSFADFARDYAPAFT